MIYKFVVTTREKEKGVKILEKKGFFKGHPNEDLFQPVNPGNKFEKRIFCDTCNKTIRMGQTGYMTEPWEEDFLGGYKCEIFCSKSCRQIWKLKE